MYRLLTLSLASLLIATSARAEDEDPGWLLELDGRFAFGVGARMQSSIEQAWALEFGITSRIGLEQRYQNKSLLAIMPEISYAGMLGGDHSDHALVVGVGIGKVYESFVFGFVPGFVAGGFRGVGEERDPGYGLRTMLIAEILKTVGVQVGYQYISISGKSAHEVRVTASLNMLPLLFLKIISRTGK